MLASRQVVRRLMRDGDAGSSNNGDNIPRGASSSGNGSVEGVKRERSTHVDKGWFNICFNIDSGGSSGAIDMNPECERAADPVVGQTVKVEVPRGPGSSNDPPGPAPVAGSPCCSGVGFDKRRCYRYC